MSAHERVVAGSSCSEILAVLSDFVDGALEEHQRQRVLDHLRGCDWCERFGGSFSSLVRALRQELHEPEPLEPGIARRLEKLVREAGGR